MTKLRVSETLGGQRETRYKMTQNETYRNKQTLQSKKSETPGVTKRNQDRQGKTKQKLKEIRRKQANLREKGDTD